VNSAANLNYSLGGIVTGLVVAGGWYVSGHIGRIAEDPNTLQEAFVATNTGRMESFSFVAPLAYSLDYLMFWTDKSPHRHLRHRLGRRRGSPAPPPMRLRTGKFRWEGFRDAEDTAMHIVGGTLMGFGGICALGCNRGAGHHRAFSTAGARFDADLRIHRDRRPLSR